MATMNKEALKRVLLDQRESIDQQLAEAVVPRNGIEECRSMLKAPNVLLISGMRRAGKSVFAHQLTGDKRYAFANFDDERLIGFQASHFQLLLEAFHELHGEPEYLLFDEIQNIAGWELFINRMRPGHRVIVTGSNANLLSSEMATHLTGRFGVWALYPMSFDEFLRFRHKTPPTHRGLTTSARAAVKVLFDEYLRSGGIFEGYSLGTSHLRTLFRSVITRDILARYRINHPAAVEQLAVFLLNAFAGKISMNKIAARVGLKSSHTVDEYVGYFEATYMFFTISKFTYRLKEQHASLKKVYCRDNGLVSSMLFDVSPNTGRFLENLVAIELSRREETRGGTVFYWDDHRRECDFVVKRGRRVTEAFQVCQGLSDENRGREVKGLCAALAEFHLDNGSIITADQEDEIESDGKRIRVIPAWRWLLQV
jgi:uncharacterized protein